jgi:hypothetical protein
MGPSIGTLLASGTIAALTASMSADAFVDWGWRLAFFASVARVVATVILLAFCVGFALHASMYGPQAALLTEQFPTWLRYCGASLAYTFAGILGGGIAPLVFASLLQAYESTLAIVLYASCALALTAIALTRVHRADALVQ